MCPDAGMRLVCSFLQGVVSCECDSKPHFEDAKVMMIVNDCGGDDDGQDDGDDSYNDFDGCDDHDEDLGFDYDNDDIDDDDGDDDDDDDDDYYYCDYCDCDVC